MTTLRSLRVSRFKRLHAVPTTRSRWIPRADCSHGALVATAAWDTTRRCVRLASLVLQLASGMCGLYALLTGPPAPRAPLTIPCHRKTRSCLALWASSHCPISGRARSPLVALAPLRSARTSSFIFGARSRYAAMPCAGRFCGLVKLSSFNRAPYSRHPLLRISRAARRPSTPSRSTNWVATTFRLYLSGKVWAAGGPYRRRRAAPSRTSSFHPAFAILSSELTCPQQQAHCS